MSINLNMKKSCTITAEQQALALLLRRECKYSYRKIAIKTNMSKTSVQKVIKEGVNSKDGFSDFALGGCPKFRGGGVPTPPYFFLF